MTATMRVLRFKPESSGSVLNHKTSLLPSTEVLQEGYHMLPCSLVFLLLGTDLKKLEAGLEWMLIHSCVTALFKNGSHPGIYEQWGHRMFQPVKVPSFKRRGFVPIQATTCISPKDTTLS